MYKIQLLSSHIPGKGIDMPKDKSLGLFEACRRADIYKRNNPSATFIVIHETTGDVEYSV